MNILITGATGLVGTQLTKALFEKGYSNIRFLTRNKMKTLEKSDFPIQVYQWDPAKQTIEEEALKNVDVVIHLAGDGVAEGRWTASKKKRILDSRVDSTALLLNTIQKMAHPPKKFISASAIGIYGDRGEETLNASSDKGTGFLADVCHKWEELVLKTRIQGMKTHIIRIGIVLAAQGGALKKMLPPFKAGIAGKLGSGQQYMSWVHLDDLVGQFLFLIEHEGKHQIYNGVSPRPVTNYVFTKVLGQLLHRPTLIPVPAMGLKIIFGEMSQILLNGQKVMPDEFQDENYKYKFSNLKDALRDLI